MKKPSSEKIIEEEYSLEEVRDELALLKLKFIKLPWDKRLIDFWEYYIAEKKNFILKLKEYVAKERKNE